MKQQIDEIKTINDMYNKALNRNESPIKFDVYNFDDNTLDNSMQYTPSSLSIEIELDDNSSRISKLKDDKRVLKIQLTEL